MKLTEIDRFDLEEYREREKFRCIHGHNGLTHKNCWKKAMGKVDRVGFFDIETFELLADWGFAYCYCIKELDGKIIKRSVTGEEVTNYRVRDKRLIRQFCEDVKEFDTLVVYYGKDTGGRYQRHDIPFMRTRAEWWGLKNFPKDGSKIIIDLYDVVKSKFKLKRNSLDHACRFKKIPCKHHPLNWETWQRARDGHNPSLKYILQHCEEDVIATEALWKAIYPYKRVKGKI